MRLEAFSAAKDPSHAAGNDDRVIVLGDSVFAVVDGVTDKSGAPLPNGFSRGRYAGVVIERVLARLAGASPLPDFGAAELVAAVTEALNEEYRRLDCLEEARANAHARCAAQLALLLRTPLGWRLIVVGDCGVRLDGDPHRTFGGGSLGDELIATWRAAVFAAVTDAGAAVEEALTLSRAYALTGTAAFVPEGSRWLDRSAHAALAEAATARAVARFSTLPVELVTEALGGGILGMAAHRNRAGPLGAACLDGFAVPLELVVEHDLPEAGFEVAELFSDGYFGQPAAGRVGVAAWEEHIHEVERVDPHKIGRHASTKGSAPGKHTDDRSVLIVYPNGASAG